MQRVNVNDANFEQIFAGKADEKDEGSAFNVDLRTARYKQRAQLEFVAE